MEETQPRSRETVRVLAALSDENRFRIVALLASEQDELSCGAIGKALDISPSLLSHHLAILADAEIIGRRKNGLWTMNMLRRPVIERQVATLQALIHPNGQPGGNGKADVVIPLQRPATSHRDARGAAPLRDTPDSDGEALAGS